MKIYYVAGIPFSNELRHSRTKGSRNGVRRYQYEDGTLTPEGRRRYLQGGARNVAVGMDESRYFQNVHRDQDASYKRQNNLINRTKRGYYDTKQKVDKFSENVRSGIKDIPSTVEYLGKEVTEQLPRKAKEAWTGERHKRREISAIKYDGKQGSEYDAVKEYNAYQNAPRQVINRTIGNAKKAVTSAADKARKGLLGDEDRLAEARKAVEEAERKVKVTDSLLNTLGKSPNDAYELAEMKGDEEIELEKRRKELAEVEKEYNSATKQRVTNFVNQKASDISSWGSDQLNKGKSFFKGLFGK